MRTEYELLKDRVEKLGDILSAVNFDSPVVASHLLVGACVEMSRIGGVLNGLKYPPYLHKLLVLGYSYANPIEKSLARVKQEVERCEVLSHEYYHAFSRMREYGRPVYDEGIKERSAYAKCSIDPLLDDDRACWKRMASLVENASYGNSPSCVSPLSDLHPYHEYVWEIIDAMNRGIKIIIASAQQIDAFVAKPTAEMVAYWMENVFETFRDKRWKDSFVRKIFEAERKKARFKRHGRNKESELDFLEKELESFSKGCSDSLLEDALVRHYDEMTGECNFEKAAQYVLPYWDSVKDESSECLEDYVENLMMIRYVMDEIACISKKQEKGEKTIVSDGAKPKSGGLKKSFADSVINGDADEVLVFLRNELEGKSTQKDVMMVFRAVMDAGLTRKPTFSEFKSDFASVVKVNINNSSFNKYLKKDFKFDESAFEYLVEKARKLR